MSVLPLTISADYGYVILAACSTVIVSHAHTLNTGKYRQLAKIPYPTCYATDEQAKQSQAAYQFNCAQRAHANFTDHQPSILAVLFASGLQYPRSAAVLGALWSVGRYLYMLGYSNPAAGKEGRGRYRGSIFYIGELGLLGLSIWSGIGLVMGW